MLRQLLPTPQDEFDSAHPDAAARLDALYAPPRPDWLRVNLVASVNGSVSGADGTSESLTRGADRRILGAIRRLSDVVLVGASSVRVEGYVLPRTAALAIVTASGDLKGHRMPSHVDPGRVLVLCPGSAVDTVHRTLPVEGAEVIALPGADQLDPTAIVSALRERRFRSIVCEGGPALASQLLDAGLVDELCLTTAPLLSGNARPVLPVAMQRSLDLSQLLVDATGSLYARWAVSNTR